MPTYAYICDSCEQKFERFQPITAKPVRTCPECGKHSVRRQITGGAGLIFKGSGFYQTDYRSKSYQEAAKKEKPEKTEPPKKTSAETPSSGPSSCKKPDVCFPDKN